MIYLNEFIETLTSLGYNEEITIKPDTLYKSLCKYHYENLYIKFIIDKDGFIRSSPSSEIDTVNITSTISIGGSKNDWDVPCRTDECIDYILDNKHYNIQSYRNIQLDKLIGTTNSR